jgi:hypothetical protein
MSLVENTCIVIVLCIVMVSYHVSVYVKQEWSESRRVSESERQKREIENLKAVVDNWHEQRKRMGTALYADASERVLIAIEKRLEDERDRMLDGMIACATGDEHACVAVSVQSLDTVVTTLEQIEAKKQEIRRQQTPRAPRPI